MTTPQIAAPSAPPSATRSQEIYRQHLLTSVGVLVLVLQNLERGHTASAVKLFGAIIVYPLLGALIAGSKNMRAFRLWLLGGVGIFLYWIVSTFILGSGDWILFILIAAPVLLVGGQIAFVLIRKKMRPKPTLAEAQAILAAAKSNSRAAESPRALWLAEGATVLALTSALVSLLGSETPFTSWRIGVMTILVLGLGFELVLVMRQLQNPPRK